MKLSAIAAISENGVIGVNNKLPWRLPQDLKNFRSITMGKPIIMGRKTFESLGHPLPGRRNIVLTHDKTLKLEGCSIFNALDDALDSISSSYEEPEAIIIGGASIFEQTLSRISRLYLTFILQKYKGDTFFPDYNEKEWDIVENRSFPAREGAPPFSFKILDRGQSL